MGVEEEQQQVEEMSVNWTLEVIVTVINYGTFARGRPGKRPLSTALIGTYLRVNRSAD